MADIHLSLQAFEPVVLEWIFKLLIQWFYLTLIGIPRQWNFFYMIFYVFCLVLLLIISIIIIIMSLLVWFQVDLQAQARAHRIGQKKDVLVLRFETVSTICPFFLTEVLFFLSSELLFCYCWDDL